MEEQYRQLEESLLRNKQGFAKSNELLALCHGLVKHPEAQHAINDLKQITNQVIEKEIALVKLEESKDTLMATTCSDRIQRS